MQQQESNNNNTRDRYKGSSKRSNSSRSSPSLTSPGRSNNVVKSERLSPDTSTQTSPNDPHDLSHLSRLHQKSSVNHQISHTPSPSASPKSQPSNSRTRTPSSFPGTPPHAGGFTSPIPPPGCFSPAAAALGAALGAGLPGSPNPSASVSNLLAARGPGPNFLDSALPRNCSDLMRSLAARYNNNNPNNNANSE